MKLYHGSNTYIDNIDLDRCNLYKDFGRAFYLTEYKDQAITIANSKVALFGGEIVINKYEFDDRILKDGTLTFISFNGYTEDWADFIFKNRDDSVMPPYQHGFDVVFGPIANDRIGMQIRNFRMGNIDKSEFLNRLKFMKGLTFQWAFCTQKAINCLRKI